VSGYLTVPVATYTVSIEEIPFFFIISSYIIVFIRIYFSSGVGLSYELATTYTLLRYPDSDTQDQD
jgi:hypothetical protein